MSDRDASTETSDRLFWRTDHHDWGALEAVLPDEVLLDDTSLQGGEPATLAPREIVTGWRQQFETVSAHQHLVTNHLVEVEGERAGVVAQFITTHQYDERLWTLGCDDEFGLEKAPAGWRIDKMVMTAVWQNPGTVPGPCS
jgi:hypothetical protein